MPWPSIIKNFGREIKKMKRHDDLLIVQVLLTFLFSVCLAFIDKNVALIVGTIGALLIINKEFIIFSHNERFQILDNTINGIAEVVHIRDKTDYKNIENLIDAYVHIPQQGFADIKNKIVTEAFRNLRDLRMTMESPLLDPLTSLQTSLHMLNNLNGGDYVKAVSFCNTGEWDGSKWWDEYLEANFTAAKNDAIVERIFIVERARLKELRESPVGKFHTESHRKEEFFRGYFINKENLARTHKDLMEEVGSGFILIRQGNEKMLVVDVFIKESDSYKTKIVYDPLKIITFESAFNQLLKEAEPLTA